MDIFTIIVWVVFIVFVTTMGYIALKVGKCPRCSAEMNQRLKFCPACNYSRRAY